MLSDERRKKVMFPHEKIRPIQDELVLSVEHILEKKKHLVVHAPTGLGKTAATIGPALAHAIENDLTVFFLTSRHTQHQIALKTIRSIEERYDIKIPVANLIGKKWMCLQPGAQTLRSGEFIEYCKKLREGKKCSYYENLKASGTISTDAKLALEKAYQTPSSSALKVIGQEQHVCPYEIGILAAKKARVIVTDYFYLFNPQIRDTFFTKIGKELEECILIVDEAHNLPDRVKDLASQRTSTRILARAHKESLEYEYDFSVFAKLEAALNQFAMKVDKDDEMFLTKSQLLDVIGTFDLDLLHAAADNIREENQRSYIGSVADFLSGWIGGDEGYTRILTRQPENVILSYRCLDPAVIAAPTIRQSYSTIMMSGTLSPTVMYAELLDIPLNSEDYTFQSPFPKENRLTLIVPHTTTKYQARGPQMFLAQAKLLAKSVDAVPGNSIIFFPSYYLLEQVSQHLETLTRKPVLREVRGMGKNEKEEVLTKFSSYQLTGAVLLAVMSGSFSEGIDLPGNLLRGVFVVGLPLARPDKETQALIQYYDEKFSRGWDYGYVFPAFNKILQSAGRCIRTGTDRGVIAFVDERYAWRNYQRCFPPDWNLQQESEPEKAIEQFFDK